MAVGHLKKRMDRRTMQKRDKGGVIMFDPFDLNMDGKVDGMDAYIFNEIINNENDSDDETDDLYDGDSFEDW